MLDELISTGAVVWSGHGRLGDRDGLIALHLAEYAAETLPEPSDRETETGSKEGERPGGGSHGAPASPLAGPSSPASGASPDLRAVRRAIVEVLADGGAYFPDQLATLAGRRICADPAASAPRPGAGIPPADVSAALWDLAWSGRVTTDTWAAPRSLIAVPPPRRRIPASSRRRRHARIAPGRTPARTGGAGGLGRWSLLRRDRLDDREPDETARGLSLAEGLLDRYAILTRDAVASDGAGSSTAWEPLNSPSAPPSTGSGTSPTRRPGPRPRSPSPQQTRRIRTAPSCPGRRIRPRSARPAAPARSSSSTAGNSCSTFRKEAEPSSPTAEARPRPASRPKMPEASMARAAPGTSTSRGTQPTAT